MGKDDNAPTFSTSQGAPVAEPYATQRIGNDGPLLLQDFTLIDSLAHFDRERIPERVVHAKGSGAYGVFEVTDDITDLCSAKFLNQVGKKTRSFVRFSTVGGEKGSADTARDPRGFAVKFYTEDGNYDLVMNNTPVFFIRDPSKFVPFIHTQKRNPETNLKDPDMFWDYLTTNQESIHQVCILFSDRGTPYGYRFMNGYSGHTYKWTNSKGEWRYVQIHFKCDQGNKTFSVEEAGELAGSNPDFAQQDLFNAIKKGEYPSWTVYVQSMTQEEAAKLPFSVFDLTKVWPHDQFPLRRFGKWTLNENPQNYFAEVEQAAFSPSHTVPGIEPSADPVLQSRLFSYPDTHRHRLGVNYAQIPVNCPFAAKKAFNPFIRDGGMSVNGNLGAAPNYLATNQPIKFDTSVKLQEHQEVWHGPAFARHWQVVDDIDYAQPRALYEKVLSKQPGQQKALAHNVAVHASGAKRDIQDRVIEMFSRVHPKLGKDIKEEIYALDPRDQKKELFNKNGQLPRCPYHSKL